MFLYLYKKAQPRWENVKQKYRKALLSIKSYFFKEYHNIVMHWATFKVKMDSPKLLWLDGRTPLEWQVLCEEISFFITFPRGIRILRSKTRLTQDRGNEGMPKPCSQGLWKPIIFSKEPEGAFCIRLNQSNYETVGICGCMLLYSLL